MRLLILPNTSKPFCSMWRTNTAWNIDVCRSLSPKTYRRTISAPTQWLLDLLNLLMIHIICGATMKNTECVTRWPKQHLDEAIVLQAYWQPQASIWIYLPNYHTTDGKWIGILMITTPTQWRLVVHFGYQISPTAGASKKKHTQSTPNSPMSDATYSLLYITVSEWRPVFPSSEMWLGGCSQEPQARPFANLL